MQSDAIPTRTILPFQSTPVIADGRAFKTMLYKEHVKQKENKRFVPPSMAPLRPRVVATAGGFRQVWD